MSEEIKDVIESGITPSLKDEEITEQVKNSFLDYAMSVIVSRALPDVRDGLKPVNRRIIYSMNESGYTPDKPFVKSAKITGEVMGKYHPHGNASIYTALVRLAQYFSMRYPLIDGHGNFGTMDGDEAAAERYTEAKLKKLSLEMVRDIKYNTVDFSPNYDGTEIEPSVLPTHFPNLLVNGSDGIAVGMATKMPPHNLREVIDGIIAYRKNPDITVEELMKYIKGPDFPTGGIIYGLNGIREAYATGKGTFRLRAKTEIVEKKDGRSTIIIREIPYQVIKSSIVKHVGELYREKKIEGITSIKDFSKVDVDIEIECKKDAIPSLILNQLFKNTQLEISYGIINLAIVNGVPKVLSLKDLLKNYIDFQVEIIEKRTNFLLDRDEKRKHILDGLLICRDNIDEVVAMVKASENKEDFIRRATESEFHFSNAQAEAIFVLQLGRLTHLEATKLIDEKTQLEKNIELYHHILESRENILDVMEKELLEIKEKYGDDRKSEISNQIVSIDDEVNKIIYSNTHTDILLFSNFGKVYRIKGYSVPEGSRSSKGVNLINILNLDKGENIISIVPTSEYENKYLFFATRKGLVKRTKLEEFIRINSNGKYAIKFNEDDTLLDVKVTDGNAKILLAASNGQLCMFKEEQIRVSGRTSHGVFGMKLEGANLISLATSNEGNLVLVTSENGLGKLSPIEDYRETKRNSKGVKTIKITDKTGDLCAMKVVNGDEDYVTITKDGLVVRAALSDVRICGRNSQGVKMVNFKNENDKVISITIVPHEEENDVEIEGDLSINENEDVSIEDIGEDL